MEQLLFLEMINVEVTSLEGKDFYEPDVELQPGDVKIGDMTERHVRLYTFWKMNEKMAEEKTTEAKFFRGKEAEKKILWELSMEYGMQARILEDCFYLEIKQSVGKQQEQVELNPGQSVWYKHNLAFRKGRLIVLFKPRPPQMIGPFPLGGPPEEQ